MIRRLDLLGEIFYLTEEEIKNYRGLILEELNKFKETKDTRALTLFLIWLYEFVEMFAVNNTGKQAKLKHVKDRYQIYFSGNFLKDLFHKRGQLVHRAYKLANAEILTFFTDNENDIILLMQVTGFFEEKRGETTSFFAAD